MSADRRVPRHAVRGPERGRNPQGGHRTGPRVGRPRERRPPAVPRGQRPQDHHLRPDQLRHHPEAPVHPEQGHPAGPGRPASRSARPSTGHYGQTETESVDSMLVEFTDTAIDFTQTESIASSCAGGRRVRRPGRQAVQPDHPGGGQPPGLRHPHRAVRRPRPRPLPDRRRAGRARRRAPPAARPAALPFQDHGFDRHLARSAARRTAGSR